MKLNCYLGPSCGSKMMSQNNVENNKISIHFISLQFLDDLKQKQEIVIF